MRPRTPLPIGLVYREWEIVGKFDRCGGAYLELKCLRCSTVRTLQSYRLTRAMRSGGTVLCEKCDAAMYEEKAAKGRLGRRKAPHLTEWQSMYVVAALRSRKLEDNGVRLYRPDEITEMVRETQDMCRAWDDAQCREQIRALRPKFHAEPRTCYINYYGEKPFTKKQKASFDNQNAKPQFHRVRAGR